jgi:eukaryotic-like serine/threonine-protein kinase
LLQDSFEKGEFKLSPDGRYIAYNSNESGKTEVYIAAFPSMTAHRQVSNAGGGIPRWRGDSRELYYLSAEGNMMAVEVRTTAGGIETGIPRKLFATRIAGRDPALDTGKYDVTGDGQRFLLLQPDRNASSVPITVVINWLAAINERDRNIR